MKFGKVDVGSSISCSGACLTVEKYTKSFVKFYISKETLSKTTFKVLKKGSLINLEKSQEGHMNVNYNFLSKLYSELNPDQKLKFNKILQMNNSSISKAV